MSSTLKFASTKKIDIEDEHGVINMPTIKDSLADGQLTKCLIVSAYTDIAQIKAMLKILKNKASKKGALVQFFFDRGASKYSIIKNDLDKLNNKIKDSFANNSGIYFVSCTGLFHSKIIYTESLTNIKILIGSINFTQNAFNVNEEVALVENYSKPKITRSKKRKKNKKKQEHRPKFIDPIFEYIQNLKTKSNPVPCELGYTYNSLRNRLLDGKIFKRVTETDPFTFYLNLSNETLKRLSSNNKDNNNTSTSELSDYLDDTKDNSISIKKLLGRKEDKKSDSLSKKERAQLKRYSLESSYGFWVPREYCDKVEDSLMASKEKKEKALNNYISILEKNCSETEKDPANTSENSRINIEKGFKKFLCILTNEFISSYQNGTSQEISLPQSDSIESKLNSCKELLNIDDREIITKLESRWENWFKNLKEKFCIPYEEKEVYDQKHIDACENLKKKLSTNLYGYPTPDIWNDIDAAGSFEKSIIDSIDYLLHRKGNKPAIIKDLIGNATCDTDEEITKLLINHKFAIPFPETENKRKGKMSKKRRRKRTH